MALSRNSSIKLIGLLLLISSLANAIQDSFTRRLNVATEKMAQIENQLTAEDYRHVEYLLGHLDEILRNYNNSSVNFICVSNGENASWEKFGVYSPAEGKVIGGYTTKETCQAAIKNTANSLICISNGENASWEKMTPYDIKNRQFMGGATSLATCYDLVKSSTTSMMCVSNGENSSWEKYTLYDRLNNKTIGGQTSKESCLSSLR